MQILVKYDNYISFQEKNNTFYLDKKNKYSIYSPSKSEILNGFKKINEIFEGIYTEYTIDKINNDYLIKFISNSGIEYRFDLFNEVDSDIYHLGFSLSTSDSENYEILTNLNESKEIFAKLVFILKDIDNKIGSPEYCIGATGNIKKDKIYQYMMKFMSWEKRNTSHYPLGWGIYFRISI